MTASLTIIRYRKRFVPFALLAMAVHRLPLFFNKQISFYKLMGSGKNGTFDKTPDWQQWGIFSVSSGQGAGDSGQWAVRSGQLAVGNSQGYLDKMYGSFIGSWFRFFNCETWTIFLEPIEGHGSWDGKQPFGILSKQSDHDGPIAVLTRASIRPGKMKQFWSHVDGVAVKMSTAKGFITSFGIGEVPWIKQATFSVWTDKYSMKQFAYSMKEHQEVIIKTRREKWYSEDMFVRFRITGSIGSIKGANPLATLNNSAKFAEE